MEPQLKKIRLKCNGQDLNMVVEKEVSDMVVEEDSDMVDKEEEELDEWMRNSLFSCLPNLKTKVKEFAHQKENRMKVKVEQMKEQLAKKENYLTKIEREFQAKSEYFSTTNEDLKKLLKSANNLANEKEKKIQLLETQHSQHQKTFVECITKMEVKISKVQEDLDFAKKTESDDKLQLKTMEEKVDNLENQHAENHKSLKNIEGEYHKNLIEIEKLKIEKIQLKENVEIAHVTITKNLEKIRQLETQNISSENEKHHVSQLANIQVDLKASEYFTKYPKAIANPQERSLKLFNKDVEGLPKGWKVRHLKDPRPLQDKTVDHYLSPDLRVLKTGQGVVEFLRLEGSLPTDQILGIAKSVLLLAEKKINALHL